MFYFTLQYITRHKGKSREGTQDRKMEDRTAAESIEEYCLLACSPRFAVCFLVEPRVASPRMAPLIVGWVLSHLSVIKKRAQRYAYSPIWWKQFLSWGFLFLDDPSFLQAVDYCECTKCMDLRIMNKLGKYRTLNSWVSTIFKTDTWNRKVLRTHAR